MFAMLKMHNPGLDLGTVVNEGSLGSDDEPVAPATFFAKVLTYALEIEKLCTRLKIIE